MDCTSCGTPLGPGIQFCPNCGTAAPLPRAPVAPAAPIVIPGQPTVTPGMPVPFSYGGPGQPSLAVHGTPNSTMAVVSLVVAISSWILAPCVGGIVAVVTGHLARGQVRRSGGRLGGDGLALAGLIMGYANIVLSCVAMSLIAYFFDELSK